MSSRQARAGHPAALAALLEGVYPGRGPEDVRAIRVFAWWDRVVPRRVADNARPVRLANGVLYVHTVSSAWASDLDFVREQLLASLQRRVPDARVRGLVIRVGPLPSVPPRRAEAAPEEVTPLDTLPEDVARAAAMIADDRVRDSVMRAAAASLAERPARRSRGRP